MNTLQIVNSVLRRLRGDEVVDFTEAYTKLILDLVNEAKREVEDAWDWSSLRTTLTLVTDTTNKDYSLVGAGQRYRFLPRDGGDVSVYNVTHTSWMNLVNRNSILEQQQIGNYSANIPSDFAITGQDSNLDPIISFGYAPNTITTIKFNLIVPQAELVNTTDTLTIPWYPVVQGAWAKAISERGEDGGQNSSEQYQAYLNTLSDAIAQDAGRLNETLWSQV